MASVRIEDVAELVVFGASYCQTALRGTVQPEPSDENPLRVPWPGVTYNEPGKPNWVGHLVNAKPGKRLRVWNYATGGQTVSGVCEQVTRYLQKGNDLEYRATARGGAADSTTLFAIWIGINDVCFDIDVAAQVHSLFEDAIRPLYDGGARRFIIFEVPPRLKPEGRTRTAGYIKHHAKIDAWNAALASEVNSFEAANEDCKLFVVKTWQLFTDILEQPSAFGFADRDPSRAYGGGIWMDGLHPTSAVHALIAQRVLETLVAASS